MPVSVGMVARLCRPWMGSMMVDTEFTHGSRLVIEVKLSVTPPRGRERCTPPVWPVAMSGVRDCTLVGSLLTPAPMTLLKLRYSSCTLH